jgi:uncharacterized protein YjbJ (UPF0337 family)
MTPDNTEEVAGGPLGKLAGRLKETAGEALGREDMAREGRLQQAGADAELEARRAASDARAEQAAADIEAERAAMDAERAQLQAEVDAERREAQIDRQEARGDAAAAGLESEARRAEARADAIDPEEQA